MPKVYTLSGNHGEYESDKWNGIIANNNSTISVDWLLSLSGSGKTFYFSGDMTGTYQNYRLNSPQDVDLSAYEITDNLLKAELTYWATTDYGGTTYTSYFYYKKKKDNKEYTYRLYVKVNDVVKIGTDIQYGGYGSTIEISVQRKQVNTTNWYSMSSWKLKENIDIYFSITNARLNANGNFIGGINGNFYIHSGYPNSNQNDNKSINYKDQINPTITSMYSWDSSPANGNPSTVSVDVDGTTKTINVVCDSSSKTGSTSGGGGGGFQPGIGLQPSN